MRARCLVLRCRMGGVEDAAHVAARGAVAARRSGRLASCGVGPGEGPPPRHEKHMEHAKDASPPREQRFEVVGAQLELNGAVVGVLSEQWKALYAHEARQREQRMKVIEARLEQCTEKLEAQYPAVQRQRSRAFALVWLGECWCGGASSSIAVVCRASSLSPSSREGSWARHFL